MRRGLWWPSCSHGSRNNNHRRFNVRVAITAWLSRFLQQRLYRACFRQSSASAIDAPHNKISAWRWFLPAHIQNPIRMKHLWLWYRLVCLCGAAGGGQFPAPVMVTAYLQRQITIGCLRSACWFNRTKNSASALFVALPGLGPSLNLRKQIAQVCYLTFWNILFLKNKHLSTKHLADGVF